MGLGLLLQIHLPSHNPDRHLFYVSQAHNSGCTESCTAEGAHDKLTATGAPSVLLEEMNYAINTSFFIDRAQPKPAQRNLFILDRATSLAIRVINEPRTIVSLTGIDIQFNIVLLWTDRHRSYNHPVADSQQWPSRMAPCRG